MTLEEILAEIDEKYPNEMGQITKIRKLNNLQNKLFRTVVKRTVSTSIDLIKDLGVYPISFSPSKIREIIVNGQKYPYRQLEGEATSHFFYILDQHIGIYPAPKEDKLDGLLVFRYQEPTPLGNLGLSPDLDPDFHSLLVYGACKELAEAEQRYDLANGFAQQFEGELDLFEQANQDTEPSQIQEEVWW